MLGRACLSLHRVSPSSVIPNNEILSINPDAQDSERFEGFRICAATRAAQRGPNATMALYQQLLTTAKPFAQPTPLLKESDEALIVDINVHSGDHALASVMLMNEGFNIKHVLLKCKNKTSVASVEFVMKGLGSFLASKGMKHEIVVKDEQGNKVAPVTAASLSSLTPSDKEYLKSINVLEAYEGVTSWQSKLSVTIVPDYAGEVSGEQLRWILRILGNARALSPNVAGAPVGGPPDDDVYFPAATVYTWYQFVVYLVRNAPVQPPALPCPTTFSMIGNLMEIPEFHGIL